MGQGAVVKGTQAVITLTGHRVTQGIRQQEKASSSGQNGAKRRSDSGEDHELSSYAGNKLWY